MKITLILAVVACACAAHALPDGLEVPSADNKQAIDFAKLRADLEAKLTNDAFLNEKFGTQPAMKNRLSTDVADNDEHVNIGGIGKWFKYVPWGTIIDVVVEAVKKATE